MIVAMVILPTLLGLLLAAMLFDLVGKKFGGRLASFLRATYYLPQILPVAVAAIVIGWILRPENGALNIILKAVGLGSLQHNWLGSPDTALLSIMFVMVWVQLGYPVVIFMAALQRVDPELYEAAELDGAGWFQRFRAITVNIIRPEIFVVALTCTIAALKVFGPIYILTRGGPGTSTIVPSYYSYSEFFQNQQVGYGATIATALTLVIVVLVIIFIKAQNAVERSEREVR
jgi:raffinose/stachyose/melibiose transport system permease protein